MEKAFSLYVHIPFCGRKCPYCDFNTYAVAEVPEQNYTTALILELENAESDPRWKGRMVQSIFFGGGTPSLFSARALGRLISSVCKLFPVAEDVEISIEANPGTLSEASLSAYREEGINRLSIGGQSFDPLILKKLGRDHSPIQIKHSVQMARKVGFSNISVDLMFGVPGQKLEGMHDDLREVVSLGIEHVSAYGLTIEEGTPYFISFKHGLLELPDEDTVVEMMEELPAFLSVCGLKRYEISNYAIPGRQARHNLAYWNGDDYLGLGAGAHSFCAVYDGDRRVQGHRWSGVALPSRYMDGLSSGRGVKAWQEELSKSDLQFEFFFLGLRKVAGISLEEFKNWFGAKELDLYLPLVEFLIDGGLLKRDGDQVAMTDKGFLLADSVIENFALGKEPQIKKKAKNNNSLIEGPEKRAVGF